MACVRWVHIGDEQLFPNYNVTKRRAHEAMWTALFAP
eukprot:CAMPEP_0198227950 /NCGR_PEP_ID=MMETSP1445-20131203/111338_1 /TAXON_ID=36898 /ORGANISM="Pyramimonas sp., Strain CCMP2087" /LENGTH=36 /DNA_ID= /DNA_START= /DNA_END= /DNA_ORIENTATION=